MDSLIILGTRFGLLILLWLFILLVMWVQRKDIVTAGGVGRRQVKRVQPVGQAKKARQVAVVEGPLQGSHMEIAALEELSLGRATDNDFQLGDDFASSRHARLFRRGSDWFVEDLDSRNGTFVQGMRIDQPERVAVGTDIKMGRTIVRLMP